MSALAGAVLAAQAALALRVVVRLTRTAGGDRVRPERGANGASVAIVLPVLDERDRIGPCLDALVAQSSAVREILVVDGGSRDGTQALVGRHAQRDARIRLVDASPVPWNATGKAWGLSIGVRAASPAIEWILFLDADVHADPDLAPSLVAHAGRAGVRALSVATCQQLSGAAEALVHPSLLATLVYRFGSPGRANTDPSAVQANGQCFLARRDLLIATGALESARTSLCEDVTIARAIAARGEPVGFYEADGLVGVRMYASAREAWRNWPRSLAMRDRFFGWREALGLVEILLVQALPLPALAVAVGLGAPPLVVFLEAALVACRVGVLAGMARAYPARPFTYWLSPVTDLPVAARLLAAALRRRNRWRGLAYVRRPVGWVRSEEAS